MDLERDAVTVDTLRDTSGNAYLLDNTSPAGYTNKGSFAILDRAITEIVSGQPAVTSISHVFQLTATASYYNGATFAQYTGPLYPVLTAIQTNQGRREGLNYSVGPDYLAPTISLGVNPITPQPLTAVAKAGVESDNVVVGTFQANPDSTAAATAFTATINWGDGFSQNVTRSVQTTDPTSGNTTTTSVAASTGTVTTASGAALPGSFQVAGTYTYSNPGTYPILVTVTSASGAVQEIRSTMVVTGTALAVQPMSFAHGSASISDRQIATFIDPGTPGLPTDYTATIEWGDGGTSVGKVRAVATGGFAVYGSHRWADPEIFSVLVRVHKASTPVSQDGLAWSRIQLTGFTSHQHLPPFNQAHLADAACWLQFIEAPFRNTRIRTVTPASRRRSPPAA